MAGQTGAARARRRWRVAAVSAGGHLVLLLALLHAQAIAPPAAEVRPLAVQLVTLRPPAQAPAPPAPTPPAPAAAEPPPPRAVLRPTPLPAPADPLPAGEGPSAAGTAEVSEAALASAATAGSGGGGGGCDMTRWLQTALRKDARVQAALTEAHRGKAVMIWNGAWIRDGDQDGNGLAAVREAIQWEVGFAPVACRNEPVHGLVLISLNDGPGSSRLVVGSGDWRWSDLLHVRR